MGASRIGFLFTAAVILSGAGPVKASSGGSTASNALPMEVHDGYAIVVRGSIGGLPGVRFLVDTGATRSVIDRRLADKLAPARWAATMVNFDKEVRVESCLIPELSFGPERALDVKMTVADLRYLAPSGIRVDAVIGWDLLKRKSFRLDFVRKLIIFEPQERLSGSFVSTRANDLFLMVQVEVNTVPVWMIADTGTLGITFYQQRLKSKAIPYEIRGEAVGSSMGGAIAARVANISRLRLGARDLGRKIHVVQEPLSGAPDGIAGYFGLAALKARSIEFDLEKNELRWAN